MAFVDCSVIVTTFNLDLANVSYNPVQRSMTKQFFDLRMAEKKHSLTLRNKAWNQGAGKTHLFPLCLSVGTDLGFSFCVCFKCKLIIFYKE